MKIPAELQNKLGFNIHRVGILFRRELIHALKEFGITPEQWQILVTLWDSDKPVNQNDIVQMTLKDKHTVSRIIQRLGKNGWLEKKTASEDKRATMIHLTQKGKSLQGEMLKVMTAHFKRIWKDFSKEEKQNLLKSLKKLRQVLGDE